MKPRGRLLALVLLGALPLRAQLVPDGAHKKLANVKNTLNGDVTVGTNGSFTLLVLSNDALLTNSANGVMGRNATAKSYEVRLGSATARWPMGGSLFVGSNGASSRLVISGGACESYLVVSGRLDAQAPASVRRLDIGAGPLLFDPAQACPGFVDSADVPVRHMLHHFTNSSPTELCVTAQLRACPGTTVGMMSVAAEAGEFRINLPCSSYLGDDASSGEAFSFRALPLTDLILIVPARIPYLACDTYSLELFGLRYPPPRLNIARDGARNKVITTWSSAYPDYRLQSANTLDGPGPFPFRNVLTAPVLTGGMLAVTNSAANPRQFFRPPHAVNRSADWWLPCPLGPSGASHQIGYHGMSAWKSPVSVIDLPPLDELRGDVT